MRFLDVKTDYAFKKVFGSKESTPVLISFLNAVLDYQGDKEIVDLDIVDPYQIPLLKGMKDTYVDVKARLQSGKYIIIEMQVLNVSGFEKRILYNAAKHYSQQLKKGDNYQLINPVVALTFTNFKMFGDSDDYISHFTLLERQRFIEYSDDVELIFIELPKFKKTEDNLENIKEKWIYFLKEAGDLNYIPKSLEEPCIEQAFQTINEAALSEEELELQEKRHDFIRMQIGALDLAKTQGIEQGIEQGKKRSQIEIVVNAYRIGLPISTISEITGLDDDEIMRLLEAQDDL